jgi:serine/threonine protein kinase
VHRDVKPENILLQFHNSNVHKTKLIDFGFATYCKSKEVELDDSSKYYSNQNKGGRCPNIAPPKKVSKKLKEVLGSPLYMAPEIVKKQSYDHKVDVWSAGVVIYAMLSGRLPFFGSKKE